MSLFTDQPSLIGHCWLNDRRDIQLVITRVLICWCGWFDWSFARLRFPTSHYPLPSVVVKSRTVSHSATCVPTLSCKLAINVSAVEWVSFHDTTPCDGFTHHKNHIISLRTITLPVTTIIAVITTTGIKPNYYWYCFPCLCNQPMFSEITPG